MKRGKNPVGKKKESSREGTARGKRERRGAFHDISEKKKGRSSPPLFMWTRRKGLDH